jgi:hypothetical protein
MDRSILKFLAPIVLFCLPVLAEAAPGMALIQTTVTPQNAPKFIAAIDKWMASPTAKQYKGRLLLQAHVADGTNPATHSIVNLYQSLADYEAFSKASQADPAWAELLNTVVPISTPVSTSMLGVVKSWGDVNDTDTVWNVHSFNVTDPAGMIATIDAWMSSPGGKKFPGQLHLIANSAGGVESPNVTHLISVGYASLAEMEAFLASSANDPDTTKFLAGMQKASTHLGASIEQNVKTWGPASLKAVTQQ